MDWEISKAVETTDERREFQIANLKFQISNKTIREAAQT